MFPEWFPSVEIYDYYLAWIILLLNPLDRYLYYLYVVKFVRRLVENWWSCECGKCAQCPHNI